MAQKKKPHQNEEPAEPASFESSLGELQQIVSQLEDGSLSLEDSMQQFERGVGLLRNCYQVLESAEQRIEVLTGTDRDGNALTEPFDGRATFDEHRSSAGEGDDNDSDDESPSDSLF